MELFDTNVIEVIQEIPTIYSYVMKVPEGYVWKAGQHALWKLPDFDLPQKESQRIFTIASAPEEGVLKFTTKIAEKHSEFKDALLNKVKEGTKIQVAGARGKFSFHEEKKKHLAVAGGIGITPFRALLMDWMDKPLEGHELTLLYSEATGEYAYQNLWKKVEKKLPEVKVLFITTPEECTDLAKNFAKDHMNEAEYLICGSPKMNEIYTKIFEEMGIEDENIVTDVFMGY